MAIDARSLDQWHAAVAEGTALLDRMLPFVESSSVTTGAAWARRIMRDRIARLAARDPLLLACPHLSSPTVAVMPSWCTYMICIRCLPLVPRPTHDAERTCDACGADVDPDQVYPVMVGASPVMVAGGVCPACHDAEVDG